MSRRQPTTPFLALDFFAGSGLVTEALSPFFKVAWANDISGQKAKVYIANHAEGHFTQDDVKDIKGDLLPAPTLAWASFPCQDLSLAGKNGGIYAPRSGLVWEWLRVIDELRDRPPILVAENVLGLVSSQDGRHYIDLHTALVERGYHVGPLLIDARHFLPQSRPRVFVVAVRDDIPIEAHASPSPGWAHHAKFLSAKEKLDNWVWWNIPQPASPELRLQDCIEWDAPFPEKDWQDHNIAMIPPAHLEEFLSSAEFVATGYRRIRQKKQVLEIRFDGLAGCLRTPCGGSSKQLWVIKTEQGLKTRFMTAREAARLMGAPDSYKLPGSYLDGYKAMGDAVALPVARYLAKHLLHPLAEVSAEYENNAQKHKKAV